MNTSKAVLHGKLKGAQCSEPLKSRVPSIWFVWKIFDFLVAQEQKLGAMEPPGSARAQPWRLINISQILIVYIVVKGS